MELDWEGKRSNALKLRRSWQRAQVFAAREELAPAAQLRAETTQEARSPRNTATLTSASGRVTRPSAKVERPPTGDSPRHPQLALAEDIRDAADLGRKFEG